MIDRDEKVQSRFKLFSHHRVPRIVREIVEKISVLNCFFKLVLCFVSIGVSQTQKKKNDFFRV